jgi:hypothetical protein
VNCAVTYAFSLYGLGRTAAGLDIIRKLPIEGIHDPHAAVFVAVLLIDENQFDAAKEYIDAAQKGPIFVEEKKLLEEAIAKMTPSINRASPASGAPTNSLSVPLPNLGASPSSPPPAPPASPPPRGVPLPTPGER